MKRIGSGRHHVLCLHGWFGSAEGWGFLPEVVDRQSYTWWFPEMRGYGSRLGETGDFTMKEYAADTLAAADSAGIDRFSIVGHSMGGKAGAALLAQAGEARIRGFVGISPVAPGAMPLDQDGQALFFGASSDDENRRTIIEMTTGPTTAAWLDEQVASSRRTSTVEAFAGASTSWILDDYSAEVGRPETPILTIVGEHDRALSLEAMQQTWLQIYPNAAAVELAGCGHYATYERPLALAATVERFLHAT